MNEVEFMNHNCGTYGCTICENLKSSLKLKELVKERIKECWKDREKFKKDKNKDMLYYTNDCLTQLQSLIEESEK